MLLNPVKPPQWPPQEKTVTEAEEPHVITLGELVQGGRFFVASCRDCGHNKKVDPRTIGLPPETTVPDIGKKMKCSCCNCRQIITRPESVRDVRKGLER